MDIDKFIKNKGLKVDCFVESDLDVEEYVQYEVRDLIKEAVNEQLRLYSVSQQRELLLAFLKCYNNGEITEYGINEVDDFLKHNS